MREYSAADISRMARSLEGGIAPERWKAETHRSPIEVIFPDGRKVVSLWDSRSYDDWWETPLGRINFGKYFICNRRTIVEYPDGRKERTALEAQGMIEIARDRQEREKSRGLLERLARKIFG